MDKIAQRINTLHRSIATYKKVTLEAMTECGKLLCEQKRMNPGQFLWWLKQNVEFSERTAHKYMRVYKLRKEGWWDEKDTVANNLVRMANPQTPKQIINQNYAEDLARKHKVKLTTAKAYVRAIDRIPELEPKKVEIKTVFHLSEDKKSKARIKFFEAMERAYDLGKRNKLLPISEKRDRFEDILEIIEK